ncbi:MAG: PQQ-dependent sugar dehydrogenase [Candidatus Eisenbacteria bacterium]
MAAVLPAAVSPLSAAITLPSGFEDQVVAGVFDYPTAFAFLPDGRVLITEQMSGVVWMVLADHSVAPDPVVTIPDVRADYVERGVLALAVDPRWPARPYVYVYYTSTLGRLRLMRYTAFWDLENASSGNFVLGSPYEVLGAPDDQPEHNGGTLRFGPDHMLYLSLGEDFTWCEAQDSTSLLGRVLRLDVSRLPAGAGGPPPIALIAPADNPYATHPDSAMQLTYAMGFRNPFRFQIDRVTGLLYVADVGDAAWEELDEVDAGFNGGWPFREGPAPYAAPPSCGAEGSPYDEPIDAYDHDEGVVIISAGVLRRAPGSFWPPGWEGNVFYADYALRFLVMLSKRGGVWHRVTFPTLPDSSYFATGILSPVDFAWGPDGNLWWLSRENETLGHRTGTLHRIRATVPLAVLPPIGEPIALAATPNPASGAVTLRFTMPTAGPARLLIVDIAGRRVARLVDRPLPAGIHATRWDGRDDEGHVVPTGIYLARLETPVLHATARIVRVR